MSELNKYSLYNYNFQNSFDKSVEFIQMFEKSDYDEILNYIVENYGDFADNFKLIQFPEVSKTLNINLDKSSNFMNITLSKNEEIIKILSVQKV